MVQADWTALGVSVLATMGFAVTAGLAILGILQGIRTGKKAFRVVAS